MRPGRPRALLFDIDGTLLHCGGAGMRSLVRAAREVFACPEGYDEALRAVVPDGMTDPLLLRGIAAALGHGPEAADAVADALLARYSHELELELRRSPRFRLLPGVPALLDALRCEPRFLLALGTGNVERSARQKLARGGISDRFACGGFGDDGAQRAALLAAAHRRCEAHWGLPLEPRDVIVLGDTVHDVAAAQANGFSCLAVATGRTPPAALWRAGARQVLPDLAQTDRVLDLLARM